jgi:hypothetical protein
MVKLKSLLYENKILVPRRSPEEREKTHIAEHYRIIQRYIRDGCRGSLNLAKSPIKILPDNLTHVGGSLDLYESKIEDLNNLEKVDGGLNLYECNNLKLLEKLREINRYIDLDYTSITKVPDFIVNVNGYLSLCGLKIEDLNNLEKVNGSLFLENTLNLKSLGKLKYVDNDLYLKNSNILKIMTEKEMRRQVYVKGEIFSW